MLIGSRQFYDIIHIYNLGQSNGDSIRHEFYARNIGVVKRVYESKHVWELKEFIRK